MSKAAPWIYRFLLAGVSTSDDARLDLQEELTPLIEGLSALNVMPVNRAVQVDIELPPISRYDFEAYEAYLIDHVLEPTLRHLGHEASITPLRARSRR